MMIIVVTSLLKRMDKVVKMLIDLISAQEKLKRKEISLANK